MKTWFYLPLLLLGFILPGCTKKTINEVVIPNQTIRYDLNPGDWALSADGTYSYFFNNIPELSSSSNQLYAVVVSMARFTSTTTDDTQTYELLPEVYLNQSYTVIHNPGGLVVEIKGVNGVTSQKPDTKVRIKIVLVPSVQ